jgi:hypothetical protein
LLHFEVQNVGTRTEPNSARRLPQSIHRTKMTPRDFTARSNQDRVREGRKSSHPQRVQLMIVVPAYLTGILFCINLFSLLVYG